MWQVLACGRRLRLALILPVVSLALIGATVDAHAAAWTGNSGASVCTGGPILFDYNQPGNCAFSGTGAATFLGQFNTPAVVIDQTLCPNQATDGTDTICGHFGMDFNNVHGTVTVTIRFDENNDLDLCVTTASAIVVGNCSTGSGPTETVTFNVACTDTRYEAQILPISYPMPGPTPLTPATYTGSVGASLWKCIPGGDKGEGNGNRDEFDHHGKGGGEGENDDTHEHEHTSSDVEERDSDHAHRGKVRYSKNGCDMRSTSINTINWNDATRTMVVTGFGTVNGLGSVPFVYTMTDNGPGSADTYTVNSPCSGSGHLRSGDFKYQHSTY
jgi:hypothetical protein